MTRFVLRTMTRAAHPATGPQQPCAFNRRGAKRRVPAHDAHSNDRGEAIESRASRDETVEDTEEKARRHIDHDGAKRNAQPINAGHPRIHKETHRTAETARERSHHKDHFRPSFSFRTGGRLKSTPASTIPSIAAEIPSTKLTAAYPKLRAVAPAFVVFSISRMNVLYVV